jgi:hypothetical protein
VAGISGETIVKLIVACVILCFVAWCTQPWVALNPVDRFTYFNWKQRSMIPEVFTKGEARKVAMATLTSAGYREHWAVEHYVADKCGDSACERMKEGFTDFFRKRNVAWNIACGLDYVVWLAFDDDENLTMARNEIYDTCL